MKLYLENCVLLDTTKDLKLSSCSLLEVESKLVLQLQRELSNCKSDCVRVGPVNVSTIDKNKLVLDPRKYFNQAHDYLDWIILNSGKERISHFKISLSDISIPLKVELNNIDPSHLEIILKRAVAKIFQIIEDEYNVAFPRDDQASSKFRIKVWREVARTLMVKLVA